MLYVSLLFLLIVVVIIIKVVGKGGIRFTIIAVPLNCCRGFLWALTVRLFWRGGFQRHRQLSHQWRCILQSLCWSKVLLFLLPCRRSRRGPLVRAGSCGFGTKIQSGGEQGAVRFEGGPGLVSSGLLTTRQRRLQGSLTQLHITVCVCFYTVIDLVVNGDVVIMLRLA